jgi:hypothetical protein
MEGKMAKKRDQNEVWCLKNVTTEESQLFWKNWCASQWGMPTFAHMRLCVEAQRGAEAEG